MSNRLLAALSAAILILTGCAKEEEKTTFANQEQAIDSYINSVLEAIDSATVSYNNGSATIRVAYKEKNGEPVNNDGTVTFYYAGYIFKNGISPSSLFATNHKRTAEEAKWNLTLDEPFEPITENLGDTRLVSGLKNGLKGVHKGDELIILFSGKYGFGDKVLGTIPAKAALAYHIWVESISNE